jgi:hypothetical protein
LSAACHQVRNTARNRTLVSGVGTTEKLGCGLTHENKNNPRYATYTATTSFCFDLNMFWCSVCFLNDILVIFGILLLWFFQKA